jgi:hypothetical protein
MSSCVAPPRFATFSRRSRTPSMVGLGAAELEMLQSVHFTAGVGLYVPGPLRAADVIRLT